MNLRDGKKYFLNFVIITSIETVNNPFVLYLKNRDDISHIFIKIPEIVG